jgi:DNA-binding transcriptional LysR family regulator
LLAFRRVVELHSFNAAARDLEMTTGAISKLIAQLESDIGVRLLNRTTRAVSVSDEGAAFYESAVRILDEVASAAEQARSQASAMHGRLRVSVPTSFALMWLSSRVPAFLAQHPQLTLDLTLNDRFVDLVHDGFDCALRIATALPDSQLVAKPLGSVDRVCVASPGYLQRAAALDRPEDLRAHDCLVYTQTATPGEWPFSGSATGRPIEVRGSYRVNNSVMLRDALVAGRGVALTPRFVVDDLLLEGELTEVLVAYRPLRHTLFGIAAHQRFLSRKVRAFFDFVAAGMASDAATADVTA